MRVEIIMPKMGESITEGTIIKWNKKVGDSVKRDEIIFEISTDKVDSEIPSPEDGIIGEILFNEGDTIEVGKTVAILIGAEDTIVEVGGSEGSSGIASNVNNNDLNVETKDTVPDEKFYSPLVLNIAQKEGVSFKELSKIQGAGNNNRVTKNDILSFIEKRKSVQEQSGNSYKLTEKNMQEKDFTSESSADNAERIPMDSIRQKVMHKMIESRDTSVHVAGVVEVDMSFVSDFLLKKKDILLNREGIKPTYLSFISYAAVMALREYPLLNASIEGSFIRQKRFVNLGIAVSIEPNGLIVPNIKNAQEMNLLGIARSINELASKARTKKLVPDDITGGTFTITNYGVFGTLIGTPIINQPEVAILGVGAVVKRPVVVEMQDIDAIAIKPMMYLTLSHDHRLVDGMLGGKFLKAIKDNLEKPIENIL